MSNSSNFTPKNRNRRRVAGGVLPKPRKEEIPGRFERIDRQRWVAPSWSESPQKCRQVQRLHALGARAVLEVLAAAERGANIEDLLADFARLDPDIWRFDLPPHGPIVVPDDLLGMGQ